MMTECHCGASIRQIHLPDDLRHLSGKSSIWVHVDGGDTRCYPEHPDDHALVATPIHHDVR